MSNIPHEGGGEDAEIRRIGYNSEKARQGELFVCLKGASRDGHDFAERAYQNGCRAFLCERRIDLPDDAVQIIVDDTRAVLPEISAKFFGYPAEKLHIIGITGTKGKTTTALLTAAILNAAGLNCAYVGSNGVLINGEHTDTVNTTPESLYLQQYFSMMVKGNVKYAVLEVSSQALAHHRVDGIHFETVAFTNLSEDHIGGAEHPTFEHYRASKKRLFTEHGATTAVYCADDEAGEYMTEGFEGRKITFGVNTKSDWTAENIEKFRDETSLGITFDCTGNGYRVKVNLQSPGRFSVYNAMCAMAICSVYGVGRDFAARILGETTVRGRFEIVPALPGRTFIIDYAHNGMSLTSALKTLREYDPERIICLFGSVGGRTKGRRRELAEAASEYADYVIITSDNPDYEDPIDICTEIESYMKSGVPCEVIPNRASAIKAAVDMSEKGDIILLAGKGHETYQLICGRKVPFSERQILTEICGSLSLK